MTLPQLETVLTVVSGHTLRAERSFKWGDPVPQFSVGSQGDWIVSAPGVVSVHLLLTFDGRRMHAASVEGAPPVYLQDDPIGCSWHALPVPCELRFGQVRVAVSCRQVGAQSSSDSKPPVDERASAPSPGPIPQHASAPPIAISDGKGGTQLMEDYRDQLTRRRNALQAPSQPPFQAEAAPVRVFGRTQASLVAAPDEAGPAPAAPEQTSPSPNLNRTLQAPGTPAAAQGALPLAPLATHQHELSPPPEPLSALNSTVRLASNEVPSELAVAAPATPVAENSAAPPPQIPPAPPAGTPPVLSPDSPTVNSDSKLGPVAAIPSAVPADVTTVARTLDSPLIAAPPDHAALLANAAPPAGTPAAPITAPIPNTALNATEMPLSTLSDGGALRDFAAQIPPSPPDPVLLPDLQGAVLPAPAAPAEAMGSPAPAFGQAQTTPPQTSSSSDGGELSLVVPGEAKRASWVKKLTLALLPVAGFFVWAGDFGASSEPVEQAVPSARVKAAVAPSAAVQKHTKASPLPATSTAPTEATPKQPDPAPKAAQHQDANPKSEKAAASTPAQSATVAANADVTRSAVLAAPPDPATSKAVRLALDAAFEGRLAEASAHYQQLAKIPDGQIYALAAHHLEQGTVRSP